MKTTINIPDDLWDQFSITVIREKGHGKKNEVIRELIRDYVESKSSGAEGI